MNKIISFISRIVTQLDNAVLSKNLGLIFFRAKTGVKRVVKKVAFMTGSLIVGVYGMLSLSLAGQVTSYAAEGDTSAITKPLDNLKTLLFAVIGAAGLIILGKNVMEFAQAYQAGDTATMNSALKGIVAGILMASIGTVVTFLGLGG